MKTIKRVLLALVMTLFFSQDLSAQDSALHSFFRQLEGVWRVPQAETSLNSFMRTYQLKGTQISVHGQSYVENESGQYSFSSFFEELFIEEKRLFRRQVSSEGEQRIELDVLENTSTTLIYRFSKTTDRIYSRLTEMRMLSSDSFLFTETVFINGEVKNKIPETLYVRESD